LFAKKSGCVIPQYIAVNDSALTMEFVDGLSVYRVMKMLLKQNRHDDIETIAVHLCESVDSIYKK